MTALRNLLTPFRRDRARDFAAGSGWPLTRAKILQVLLTEGDSPQGSGELPWRTAFGSGVHLARHLSNTAALAELTRVRVRDALGRWLPQVDLRVDVVARGDQHVVRVAVGSASIEYINDGEERS
jgi:phage baseplate assembly protein W